MTESSPVLSLLKEFLESGNYLEQTHPEDSQIHESEWIISGTIIIIIIIVIITGDGPLWVVEEML